MQEFRIALKTAIPFSMENHAVSAGVADILKQAKAAIEAAHPGVKMDLEVIVVTPRPAKTPRTVAEVRRALDDAGLINHVEPPAPPATPAPPAQPATDTKQESAEDLLKIPTVLKREAPNGFKPFDQMTAEARAKREAEKSGAAA